MTARLRERAAPRSWREPLRQWRDRTPALPGPAYSNAIAVHASGRYLIKGGQPLLLLGDTAWSAVVQLTTADIDTYLNDCQSRGFNALVVNFIEHYFTSQSPAYNNKAGQAPFATMGTPPAWQTPNEAYWSHVDYLVNGAASRNIVLLVLPAYSGFPGSDEGWDDEYNAASDANLQAYGTFLGQRFTQWNIIWIGAGDKSITGAEQTKQLNVFSAIRTAQPSALMSGHGTTTSRTRQFWAADYTSVDLLYYWAVNNGWPYGPAAASYAEAPVKPVVMFEPQYEGSASVADTRRVAWQAMLSGCCGHIYGNSNIWSFSSPHNPESWSTHLADPGRQQMAHVRTLLAAYSWWLLEPKTDASLISSALGVDSSRVCPARASNGAFALVYVPASQTVTLVKGALTPANIRVRLYDPVNGSFSTHTASTPNTGTLDVATGGERVVVVDAA